MKVRLLLCLVICLSTLGSAHSARAKQFHVVDAGDTLWDISRSYGCELDALREQNGLKGDALPVGRRLQIPSDSAAKKPTRVAIATEPKKRAKEKMSESTRPVKGLVVYKITSGDTLGSIAGLYDTSVDDLVSRNGLGSTAIYAGKKLKVLPGAGGTGKRFILGQSVGATNRGRLRNASRLKAGPGYFIRRPKRTYGAEHTIRNVKRAVSEVRRRHKRAHSLAVGDISAKRGGKISMHASHQSGRDIDLGFYFVKRPVGYPRSFVDATAKNLDFDATWTLLMSFVDSQSMPGGAEQIFISYETQKLLYKKARKRRISKARLAKVLQYPHGRGSRKAIVRHEPGHNEHMHVRFSCPPKDGKCK
ncbi:MAG: LysM peptidoglycan-binding domain-containing protein [Myxococcales bacterium]|nr:LysM peptidoglycan-binding domain-containing protein [Myxococcales bacterium]